MCLCLAETQEKCRNPPNYLNIPNLNSTLIEQSKDCLLRSKFHFIQKHLLSGKYPKECSLNGIDQL